MASNKEIKFGPAGLGPVKSAFQTIERYRAFGFKACEIAFTYGIYIKNPEDAEKIGEKARQSGISLSIHAPYYVNLNSSEKSKIEATKKRILDCCEIGERLGAGVVVFHPGYYGKNREQAYRMIKKGIQDIMAEIRKNNWKIKLAPETMGKVNVFGGVEEISSLARETGCSFCLDFAHILARDKEVNYRKIEKLFPQKEWHTHFSGIVYGKKGEKHHKKTETKEWQKLLKNLPKNKNIAIINESPDMIEDSIEGLKIAKRTLCLS